MNGNNTNYRHPNLPINGSDPKSVNLVVNGVTRTLVIRSSISIGEGVSTVAYTIEPKFDVTNSRVSVVS